MSGNKIYIKHQDHFKLYVLLKYKSTFESTLLDNNIDFYYNINEQVFGDSIRYFLLSRDKNKIDSLLVKKEIVANLEQNLVDDFDQARSEIKFQTKAYFIVFFVILFLIVSALLIENWLTN